jgi:NADH:ubiquinone oxidoreductase subunit 6 (subunit J)
MSWTGPNLSFWLITLVVVIPAFFAAFSRSIVRAAFSLFFTLFGMAGYYVLLGSDFIAVTQVIIYVGGILVLIMFGVLLTNRSFPATGLNSWKTLGLACLPAAVIFTVLARVIYQGNWVKALAFSEPPESLHALGRILLGEYLPALEIAGMTLLLCLIGAAYLVRRNER